MIVIIVDILTFFFGKPFLKNTTIDFCEYQ